MALIECSELTKTFRLGSQAVAALDRVSFRIEEGDRVAVVGSSGSGKSTLLQILGCLDAPDSGAYLLDGKPVAGLPEDELAEVRNRKIGFVFQSFFLLPRATARENVELPLLYRGRVSAREVRDRAGEALERVGLSGRSRHLPQQLSGGERQRVAIARALASDPRILLADEPTGNLDPQAGQEVFRLFKDINMKGTTVLVATHDWETVQKMQRRIVTMEHGKIVTDTRDPVLDRTTPRQEPSTR